MEFNFNDQKILEAYINQALPKLGLENLKDRIIAGKEGGLAYLLFENNIGNRLKIDFTDNSREKRLQTTRYYDFIEQYIEVSRMFAEKHGFGILCLESDALVKKIDSSPYHSLVIGDSNIDSLNKLEKFLEMIKSERLKKFYQDFLDSTEEIRNRTW